MQKHDIPKRDIILVVNFSILYHFATTNLYRNITLNLIFS